MILLHITTETYIIGGGWRVTSIFYFPGFQCQDWNFCIDQINNSGSDLDTTGIFPVGFLFQCKIENKKKT